MNDEASKQEQLTNGARSPIITVSLLTGYVLNPQVFNKKQKYDKWLQRLKTNQYGIKERASVRCILEVVHKGRLMTYSYAGEAVPLFSPRIVGAPEGELLWEIDFPNGGARVNFHYYMMSTTYSSWVEYTLKNPLYQGSLRTNPDFLAFVEEVNLGFFSCYNEFYVFPSRPDASFLPWWKASKTYLQSLSDYDSETVLQYQKASQLLNLFVSSSREDIRSGRYLDVIKELNFERARTAVYVQYYKLYPNLDTFQSQYFMFPHTHDVVTGAVLQDAQNPAIWITECLNLMQKDLRRIIAGAPPTTSAFMVYRGLTKPFGTSSGALRRYAGFLSTSGDFKMSDEYFRGPYGNLLCITVPPGYRCLIAGAYKIQTECEVLFAPGMQLEIDRYDVSRSSIFQGKNPLFVTLVPDVPLAGVKRERTE